MIVFVCSPVRACVRASSLPVTDMPRIITQRKHGPAAPPLPHPSRKGPPYAHLLPRLSPRPRPRSRPRRGLPLIPVLRLLLLHHQARLRRARPSVSLIDRRRVVGALLRAAPAGRQAAPVPPNGLRQPLFPPLPVLSPLPPRLEVFLVLYAVHAFVQIDDIHHRRILPRAAAAAALLLFPPLRHHRLLSPLPLARCTWRGGRGGGRGEQSE